MGGRGRRSEGLDGIDVGILGLFHHEPTGEWDELYEQAA